ncbi:MAG TPA: response regulator [Gemmatimonadales bacterium]|nr:response regulator [Gemmatimonadales bacterium]
MSNQAQPTGLPLVLLAGERGTEWLARLLEAGGYAVLRERTGRHAQERAHATQPDVIVIDAELPDMDPVELCRALRHDAGITISTPILVCLAGTPPDPPTRAERLAALRAGAWECIAPPHDADEILLKVDAFVHAKLDADRARAEGLLDPLTGLYNRQGLARRARELGSQAFREHGALACVVLALDFALTDLPDAPAVAHGVQALKTVVRVSDVIGRLSPAEFAVLAPGTDASGARRLAERLAGSLQAVVRAAAGPGLAGGAAPAPQVRCGYEAVANVGYSPTDPVELLVRASTALRTGRAEVTGGLIRRFEQIGGSPA